MAGRWCSSRSAASPRGSPSTCHGTAFPDAGEAGYTDAMLCPCGNPAPLAECCQPLLNGERTPETAEALMRSRYTAYATGEVDYIIDTQAPGTRHTVDRESTAEWSRKSTWKGLEVVRVEAGGSGDQAGIVEFVARYEINGEDVAHREIAEFRREEGRWYFVDGHPPKEEPYRRTSKKVGPNEPCPCGSGRKHKKCCGRI